jgi:L-alanine-DL-glutamate epimerase-like enolase superfamily enzyme
MPARSVTELDLRFKKPAGTSHGYLTSRKIWVLREGDSLGEVAPLPWLSIETEPESRNAAMTWQMGQQTLTRSQTFAEEMLRLDPGNHCFFTGPFTEGKSSVRINGLVWMSERSGLEQQIRTLLDEGFRCVKMKVGSVDWRDELAVLRSVLQADPSVELRVDANGSFTPAQAEERLLQLAEVGVRNIEQPIAPGQLDEMAHLCALNAIDVALDEELIRSENCADLLDYVKPQFVVLKPSLLGGFGAAERWIEASEDRGVGWWVTSALESNIGLNALAQWLAHRGGNRIHGLGTGSLYVENFDSPLVRHGEHLKYDPDRSWNLDLLNG